MLACATSSGDTGSFERVYLCWQRLESEHSKWMRVYVYACMCMSVFNAYKHKHTDILILTPCCARRLVAEQAEEGGGVLSVCNLCGESLGSHILISQLYSGCA